MKKSALNSVWCVSDYNSIAQEIVITYKYDAIRGARKTIVCEMLNALPVLDVIVTNVPTATSRVRQRGFDHCSLIAKDVAKSRNLTYASLLYRTGSSHQVGSTKAERIKQAKGLFYSRNPAFIKNKRILLVDDVATTGATLESAARALKNAGAIEVFGLVFAKKT